MLFEEVFIKKEPIIHEDNGIALILTDETHDTLLKTDCNPLKSPPKRNFGVQAEKHRTRPYFRSKSTMSTPDLVNISTQTPQNW